jgi:hypothetical protein
MHEWIDYLLATRYWSAHQRWAAVTTTPKTLDQVRELTAYPALMLSGATGKRCSVGWFFTNTNKRSTSDSLKNMVGRPGVRIITHPIAETLSS